MIHQQLRDQQPAIKGSLGPPMIFWSEGHPSSVGRAADS